MRRRTFLGRVASAAIVWPLAAAGQQALPVIGWLSGRTPDAEVEEFAAFRIGLRDAGLIEGRDVAIVYVAANGDGAHLPDLAAELVRRKVAVVVAVGGGDAVPAARAASSTIPIVATFAQDPVSLGHVASLARPGGTITGVSFMGTEIQAKNLELLRELVPSLRSVAALINIEFVRDRAIDILGKVLTDAGDALGLRIEMFAMSRDIADDAVFESIVERGHRAALMTGSLGLLAPERRARIVALARRHRLPAIYFGPRFNEFGALMSNGSDVVTDVYQRLGLVAARVLRGAAPAELPIEQPTKFVMTVNLTTAYELGLAVPPSILARADRVLE